MRVLICGSRNWRDYEAILTRIEELPPDAVIVHGGAPGADSIAGLAGALRGHKVEEHPADWRTHGKAAGPIRNQQMIDTEPALVIAFRLRGPSRGTDDCLRRARAAGIPVEVIEGQP